AEIGVALAAIAPGAHGIALARALQLQDLGAHIGEDHRAERPGHVLGQIEHLQAVEQPVPGRLFVVHLVALASAGAGQNIMTLRIAWPCSSAENRATIWSGVICGVISSSRNGLPSR